VSRRVSRWVRRLAELEPADPRVPAASRPLVGAVAGRHGRAVLDAVWAEWLDGSGAGSLWPLLLAWDQPATGSRYGRSYVALALGVRPGSRHPHATAEQYGGYLVEALGARPDHPVAHAARGQVRALPDGPALGAVFAAAVAEPAGAAARLCADHGLAPADPVAAAVFLLRTGQVDRYRAADPDGTLVAGAYAAAPAAERAALRVAVLDAGAFDLLRRLTGAAAGPAERMDRAELDRLADRLAAAGEHDRLWRLLLDASPAQVLRLVHRLPGGWRPADPAGQRLYEVLATAPEAVVQAAAMPYAATVRVPAPRYPHDLTFAAGADEMLVVGRSGEVKREPLAVVGYRLAAAEPAWRAALDAAGWGATAVHLGRTPGPAGAGTVVVGAAGGFPAAMTLLTIRPDGVRSRPWGEGCSLVAGPGGFVGLAGDGRLIRGDAAGYSVGDAALPRGTQLFADPLTGRLASSAPTRPQLGPDPRYYLPGDFDPHRGDPIPHTLTLYDPDLRRLADVEVPDTPQGVTFAGPDRLITAGLTGGLTSWVRDGDTLRAGATRPSSRGGGLLWVEPVGKVAFHETLHEPCWLDAVTLEPADPPAEHPGGALPRWAAPRGDWLAARDGDEFAVFRLLLPPWLAGLAERPLAGLRPADAGAVPSGPVSAPVSPADNAVATGVATVVRAMLEHRFGAEIELGTGRGTTGEAYDIVIGSADTRKGQGGQA
jgi:hypothetical protein